MLWLRSVFCALAALVLLALVWLNAPTSLLFQPVAVTYDRNTGIITLKELIKWGGPLAVNFSHQIRMVRSNMICGSSGFRILDPLSPNQEDDDDETFNFSESWLASDRLKPCLDQSDYIASFTWSALLFGVIPLRPVTLTLSSDAVSPPPIVIESPKRKGVHLP